MLKIFVLVAVICFLGGIALAFAWNPWALILAPFVASALIPIVGLMLANER
jgi:hypothetical protein